MIFQSRWWLRESAQCALQSSHGNALTSSEISSAVLYSIENDRKSGILRHRNGHRDPTNWAKSQNFWMSAVLNCMTCILCISVIVPLSPKTIHQLELEWYVRYIDAFPMQKTQIHLGSTYSKINSPESIRTTGITHKTCNNVALNELVNWIKTIGR